MHQQNKDKNIKGKECNEREELVLARGPCESHGMYTVKGYKSTSTNTNTRENASATTTELQLQSS